MIKFKYGNKEINLVPRNIEAIVDTGKLKLFIYTISGREYQAAFETREELEKNKKIFLNSACF